VRIFRLSWLIAGIAVICSAINPAAAQEEWVKVIASGQQLKDWRFRLCNSNGCVAKVVLCAPGYHIIYGNKCVVNIHTPPSWEGRVQPILPPCEGCENADASLYLLYAGSAQPRR
jgi:hypothetical protein